ncbi:methyl-CpG-binding domain protein 4 [Fistulifera solaris]|uniref:Methyl-CpG-binding domain protein 4 n=1 Tax=Fistulifera solaris TaxID=1519565 RepID=A0A1Z5KQC2_FISSO|nr:methyl-CpG-binding domain protein 4 [Fistulifera solaris]|eukprot:GAX28302.1 methyl-CpG-binding domain protein 4 [Fistulifera solaris]
MQQVESNSFTKQKEVCREARLRWLSENCNLEEVEDSYRGIWEANVVPDLSNDTVITAGERLALLYIQSGRTQQADVILKVLGYKCRLAHGILDYPTSSPLESPPNPPCQIYNDYLDPLTLNILRDAFLDPGADYWVHHSYSVEPPSPYYSFVVPLESIDTTSCLGNLLRSLQSTSARLKSSSIQQATAVELWAHNRPHASGHQFHFDTDNEGCGGVVQHPIVTCILYLDAPCGGPSVVTQQRVSSRALADTAWLCPAKSNQLVVMDGKVLHGVVPGKGTAVGRRVTLMVAFWKHIRVRDTGAAARPFPWEASWAQTLLQQVPAPDPTKELRATAPIVVKGVYESVEDNRPWNRAMGLPEYDEIWQGF